MSIEVMTYVWKHSQQKGSALLLLLAIADHAHDDGTGAYPSVETLAAKSRMTSRNVQYLLRSLASSKEIIVEAGAGPKGANIYTIPLDISGGVKTFQGETQSMLGVKPVSPKPSLEPSKELPPPIQGNGAENVDGVWPDWYATLYAIPRFKRSLKDAAAWLKAKGISEEHAEVTAYALKGKWNPKQWPDPWATFQNWCKRPPLNGGANGKSRLGAPADQGQPPIIYHTTPFVDGKPVLGK